MLFHVRIRFHKIHQVEDKVILLEKDSWTLALDSLSYYLKNKVIVENILEVRFGLSTQELIK